MPDDTATRRAVLSGIGASLLGGWTSGNPPATDAGRYAVGVYDDRGIEAVERAASSVHRVLRFDHRGSTICGRFPSAEVDALRADPNVRYVEANGRAVGLGRSASGGADGDAFSRVGGSGRAVPDLGESAQSVPDAIERVNADVAIDEGRTGDGIHVAIVDSGIQSDHEDLDANLGEGWAATDAPCTTECPGPGGGVAECREAWDDDNVHGTQCAGIVGAADNDVGVVGVAPDVTLHAVKVLDCNLFGTAEDLAAGITHAADRGWDVANLSVGLEEESAVVRDAVAYAREKGVVLVAAAGNGGRCEDCVFYPAAYDEVVAVGAVNPYGGPLGISSVGPEIDLAAPGADVRTTVLESHYAGFTNTSAASPFVSGAVAQLLSAGCTAEEVRDRLTATADDVGLPDDVQGAGHLNVAAALGLESDGGSYGVDDSRRSVESVRRCRRPGPSMAPCPRRR